MPRRAAIEIQRLRKVYAAQGGPVTALEDVSFTVFEEEFVAIVGP
ncbi:MAG: nitrate ABC transporter ATP-binding protein, partial [Candidatus Rokubacteria bacterium]|nr:nitrate ABC transporter ATP-binding protein [Candidatus Rokubacteria bacterium]